MFQSWKMFHIQKLKHMDNYQGLKSILGSVRLLLLAKDVKCERSVFSQESLAWSSPGQRFSPHTAVQFSSPAGCCAPQSAASVEVWPLEHSFLHYFYSIGVNERSAGLFVLPRQFFP